MESKTDCAPQVSLPESEAKVNASSTESCGIAEGYTTKTHLVVNRRRKPDHAL